MSQSLQNAKGISLIVICNNNQDKSTFHSLKSSASEFIDFPQISTTKSGNVAGLKITFVEEQVKHIYPPQKCLTTTLSLDYQY